MKQIITIIIVLFRSILIVYSQSPNVLIKADFPKYKHNAVPYTYSLLYDGSQVFQSDELLMENGEFQIETEIHTPHTLVVFMGEEENILFLNSPKAGILILPGDSLRLSISDFGFDHIMFSGKGSTRFAFEKSYKAAINAHLPKKPIRDAIEKLIRANLKATKTDDLIAEYNKHLTEQEKKIIIANKYLDIYSQPVYNISNREYDSKDVKFITDHVINNKRIKRLIELSNEERQKLNLSGSYQNLLIEYAYIQQTLLNKRKYTPHKSTKDDYFTLNSIYKDVENRNYLLGKFIISRSYRQSLEDGLDECFGHYFSNFASNNPLYSEVKSSYYLLNNNLSKGALPPNFVLADSLGDSVKLSDLKGKVVVLDFWFYGCGGCAQITPALADIKKQFGKREDLIFVSVSIDKYRQSWLKGIGEFSPKQALHLYTNGNGSDTPIIKHFNIKSYPTLMILDKNGKVFEARASRPDSDKDKLINEINSALLN
ncbi:TlpA family protein disulfide reductase [Sphingobacterium faecale]|uniref:TlpA family protein disulfide reductase n=1 Tax=Sphingobacterium faecale TaxID=2803775 RepID=A0ABS1R815_9SPHI|nr:thioredoxin-like domain-containing protein [Sphingobacterium faecale]MBL1410818.1 TlpA family protein disulfide reductase [Sphingobacterium faecale]